MGNEYVHGVSWYPGGGGLGTYCAAPSKACGVVLVDVRLKLAPNVQIRLHPIHMAQITLL